MTEPDKNRAIDVLRDLVAVLQDEDPDPDDLIHAFGVVEENKATVAVVLVELLDQTTARVQRG